MNKNIEKEKIWPQVLAIIVSCLTSLSCGLAFSWPSPSIPLITKSELYDINEEEASYFTVLPPITMIIGVPIFSKLADVFGRKPFIFLMGVFHCICFLLIAIAKSIYVFYISRLIAGLSDAVLFTSVPMYIGEITTPNVRGTWGNLMTFMIYLGQCSVNIVGSYFSVTQTGYILLVVPLFFMLVFPFMPESPYFYIIKRKHQEAKNSLKWLRRKENVEEEFSQLISDVERQMSESGSWKDLFLVKSNRRALYAGLFLRISQQLGGISVFLVYTQFIFKKSGGNLSSQESSIIFTATVCVFNLIAGRVLNTFGRKKSYFWSCLLSGIILLFLSIYFYIDQFHINLAFLNFVPLTGMMLFVLTYSFGMGIVPTLMLGELFSASIKGKGLTILTMVFGILVSSTTKLFYFLDSSFGLYSPFLFFSICSITATFLTLHFVPETKGKTLEEIQQYLKGNTK